MKHAVPQAAPAAGAWLTLAITLAIQAMTSMSLVALPAMAPVVAAALGVSPALTGLYVAVVYAAGMVSTLSAGAAVARYGAIRVSQAGLVLCALGLALCAVPSVWATAVGAVLIGLGYGPITPASSHLLALTTPAHRLSLVFSVKQTGVPLGGALAGAIVPSLMLLAGWQAALLCTAVSALLCAIIAQPLRLSLDADRQLDKPIALCNLATPVRLVLAHPALLTLAGCSFVFSIAQLSLTSYVVTYMHETLAYGLVFAGLALSLSQLGGVAGRVLWGWIADHWFGARRILAVLAFIMLACCGGAVLLQASTPPVLTLALLFVFGASAIGWNGVYLAEVARQAPPGMASIATGGTLAFTYFGVVIGPPIFGAVSGLFGSYRAGFIALAIPVTFCGLALLRTRRVAGAAAPSA
ncbi:MAG: MFS transporter [Burkholderiaceae bacterium]|nr:MFS transporter [Burkholderiaceae bacterium]